MSVRLRALCDELGFSGFDDEIREVLDDDSRTQRDLLGLRGRVDRHDVIIEELQRRVLELERQLREQRIAPEKVEKRVEENRGSSLDETFAKLKRQLCGIGAALSEEVSRLKEAEAKRYQSHFAGASDFVCNQTRPLDGIIAHLTRQCGGNVHTQNVVKVTASSCYDGEPENVVDLESDLDFCSEDKQNSWICYDFGGQRVTPTSYSLRSNGGMSDTSHPRSWVLEVSNDGSEGSWKVVDSRKHSMDLNASHVMRNFAISAPPSGAFRFVRLRQTGKNYLECDSLAICALELFGTLSRE